MKNKSYVTYTDFGAVGDGITDDFAAICATHEYANKHSLPVITDDGKTYLIRETFLEGEVRSALIKTDVTWGSSRFIIDDTDVDFFDGSGRSTEPIFKIMSEYGPFEITDEAMLASLSGIGEGTKNMPISLGYSALLVIYNDDHSVYHRYGATYISRGGQCSPQNEVILVDGEGKVDESTPFMFDYERVTRVTVIRCDIKPLTIRGGIFTTLASRVNSVNESGARAKYIHRNILINRSHTTLLGVEHYVENEISLEYFMENGHHGPHCWGFFNASYATNVLLSDCVLTGRRSYKFSTYEFHADHVNEIRLIGCRQSNFVMKDEEGRDTFSMSPSPITNGPRCWGIGGTNFCKNMEYERCRLSRFDAHQGLYNGKIKDSEINFMEVIGKGNLTLENVIWNSPCQGRIYNSFVYLRDDFGCTWDGTITLKDCIFNVSDGDAYVFFYSYTNWDYGYRCHFPNLIVDNPKVNNLSDGTILHIVNEKGSVEREPGMHLPQTRNTPAKKHSGVDFENDMTNLNPVTPPEFIKIINNIEGYEFVLPRCDFFDNTEKIGVKEV